MTDPSTSYAIDPNEELPPTDFEIQQARHAKVLAQNELRELRRLAAANRKAGRPQPKVGDKMWVSVNATLTPRRTRAGVQFEKGARVPIEVVDMTDDELAEMRVHERSRGQPNPLIVTPHGAEQILADDALNVHKTDSALQSDYESLRATNAQLEEELRVAREEARTLRAARMAAQDSPTGAPARLQAAAAAAAAAKAAKASAPTSTSTSTPSGDFGPPDTK
jgi:hypothetical protein